MATGHVNPGYFYPVSNLDRVNKLSTTNFQNKIVSGLTPEISNKRWLLTQPNLSNDILEDIRRKASESWKSVVFKEINSSTTYLGNYQYRKLDEPTKIRPTSPTRMNNPHPSAIFLTCRLHYMPGFHREETKQYQIENGELQIENEKEIILPTKKRESQRSAVEHESKFQWSDQIFIPSTDNSFQTHQNIEITRPKSTISCQGNRCSTRSTFCSQTGSKLPRPHTTVPKNSRSKINSPSIYPKNLIYQKTQYPRGDYSIHYQWPVTIPHHKLY